MSFKGLLSVRHLLSGTKVRRQMFFVILGDGITFACQFGVAMILARVISRADLATFRQITYLGPLALTLCELGLVSTIYRYWRQYDATERLSFLSMLVVAAAFLGLAASGLLLLLSGPLARAYGNPDLQPAMAITAWYPFVALPFMLVRPVLICGGHSLKATLLETLMSLLGAAAVIIPLRWGWTLNEALGVWMGANLSRLIIAAWLLGPLLRGVSRPWRRDLAMQVWRYAWPIQLSRLPVVVFGYFDKVVTSVFLTPRDFAAYSLGARELPFLSQIATSMSSVLIPKLAECVTRSDLGGASAYWQKACLTTARFAYPIAAFAIWHATPIVRFLFSAAYDESRLPFQVFAALSFVRIVEYGSLAKAMERTGMILRAATLAAFYSVILSVPLTWLLGVQGVCMGVLLTYILTNAYYLFAYRRLLKLPIKRFFPYPSLCLLFLWSFGATGIADALLGESVHVREQQAMGPLFMGLLELAIATAAIFVLPLAARQFFGPMLPPGKEAPTT